MFLDRVIHFGETLGDQVKGRTPKKLKFLIEGTNVVEVKVNVISFNRMFIASRKGVHSASGTFVQQIGNK